ncbi:CHAT domain-containing protein [Micromonospora sp. NBC_00821]|uniref:CHAT domain-containing protein n=1 Tax=Micromonospora sp. NBC_00821 TaxID=2975977 RepID=UPI002ED64575|nr:CHAT domain-containing protein [Micromonospora sp. NBC_00821]
MDDGAIDRQMALAREWDGLLQKVRELDGFADFLHPPRLETLLPAAKGGPVVVINVSRGRCDALIVRTSGVTLRELPDLSLTEVGARTEHYLSVLQDAEQADIRAAEAATPVHGESPRTAARRQRDADQEVNAAYKRVDTMLTALQQWMWDTITEPVLDKLGFGPPVGPISSWPRVWWCPTGPLALLPLHTAGHHNEHGSGRTVLDRAVSSYTPTLRALLEARRPGAADRGLDRLLVVDVPDLPGLRPIDNAATRAALIDAFPEHRRTVLGSADATPSAVLNELPVHRWVHFSCHGDQDLADPSRGGLRLRDGVLTVESVATQRFHGDFAGLSACKTAVGGVDLPDEAITLAAALHYTGYRHVVAALWAVDNSASTEVFTSLYRAIAANGRIEPDRAPSVLHEILRRMRNRNPDWPHRWTPFAHTGP